MGERPLVLSLKDRVLTIFRNRVLTAEVKSSLEERGYARLTDISLGALREERFWSRLEKAKIVAIIGKPLKSRSDKSFEEKDTLFVYDPQIIDEAYLDEDFNPIRKFRPEIRSFQEQGWPLLRTNAGIAMLVPIEKQRRKSA